MSESQYRWRISVACPESLMTAANHLAVAVGEMAGDFYTFTNANHQDANGNRYAVMSTVVTELFFVYSGSQLTERDFAPDGWSFKLASEAQAKVNLWMGPTEQQPTPPLANTLQIVGVVGDDALAAISAMGLTMVPEEEPI
jgi:hypothetical protein